MTDSTQPIVTYLSDKLYRTALIEDTPILNFKSMDDATKAMISDEQAEEYREKYSIMRTHAKEDMKVAKQQHREIVQLIQKLYGTNSKQYKYMDRQTDYDMTGTEIYNHYAKYTNPRMVEDEIKIAKGRCSASNGTSSSNAIAPSESNIQDIDKAIKYLTQQGYTYSIDFTSHNAVSIAMALGMENIMLDLVTEDCAECVEENQQLSNTMQDTLDCSLVPSIYKGFDKDTHSESGLNIVHYNNLIKVTCKANHTNTLYNVELNESNGEVVPQKVAYDNE